MVEWITDNYIIFAVGISLIVLFFASRLCFPRKQCCKFRSDVNIEIFDRKPEKVEFATFAPRSITQNSGFILDVWAYLPYQYTSVTAYAQELGREINIGRKAGVPVPTDAILAISINIEGLNVQDPVDTIVWGGVPTNASFLIEVSADTTIGKYPGKAVVSYQGIAIAKILFFISVTDDEVSENIDYSDEIVYPQTAFASYASEDREEVLSRIQGMKKVAPELDIFLDVFSLRSGQNWQKKLEQHVPTKDTFYLFWSQSAARSEWVEREWKLALSKRGMDYIDPVPLEEPDLAPPPQELSTLHFNDAYISYIKYLKIKKESQLTVCPLIRKLKLSSEESDFLHKKSRKKSEFT